MAASATVAKPSPALTAASPMLSNTFASLSRMPAMLSLMLTTPSLMLVITSLMASPIAVIGVARFSLNSENESTISARLVPTASSTLTTASPMVATSSLTDSIMGVTLLSRSENAETMSGRLSVTADAGDGRADGIQQAGECVDDVWKILGYGGHHLGD